MSTTATDTLSEQPCSVLALVAGGRSSRMGHDKALLRIDGETVFARTLRLAIAAGFSQIWVVGREFEPVDNAPVRFLPDDFPDRGPLEGIATVLRRLPPEGMVDVIPCDLPGVTAAALVWMRILRSRMPEVSPGWTLAQQGRRQPLVSAWSATTLPRMERFLVEGNGSAGRCADVLGMARVEVPDIHELAFRGANTPDEWHCLTGTTVSDSLA
ncbi:MAG: molybdenum cofactor guanylyltransferase [Armatimonadaceae bacterium]